LKTSKPRPWTRGAGQFQLPVALASLALAATLVARPASGATTADADPDHQAVHLLRKGDVEGAAVVLRTQIHDRPKDMEAQELLLDIYANMGLGEALEKNYGARAKLDNQNADAWYLYGRAATTAGAAQTAYKKALEIDPKHARAMMGLASVDRALHKLEQAQEEYREALAIDDGLAEAWAGLGASYLADGEPSGAIAVARQALVAVPTDPEAFLVLASLVPEDAIPTLQAGITAVPDEPRLYHTLAREYLERGDASAAVSAYEQAAEVGDETSVVLERQLAADVEAGTLDAAGAMRTLAARDQAPTEPAQSLEALTRLAQKWPRCGLLQVARGHVLAQLTRNDEAEAAFRAALKLDAQDPEANGALGLLMMVRQKPSTAVPFLDLALRYRPHDASLAIARGMALAQSVSAGAGIRVLAQTVLDFPQDPRPVVALATLQSAAGDKEGAWKMLEEAVYRNPHPNVLAALAAAARDTGRKDEAIALLERLGWQTEDPRFSEAAAALKEASSVIP
jgi:tetratricopeptide (TPR) repeat protein